MAKLKINVQAPEFSLEDYNRSSVSLSNFEGSKHVVLIFNRGFM
jgi:peroxiredoxin